MANNGWRHAQQRRRRRRGAPHNTSYCKNEGTLHAHTCATQGTWKQRACRSQKGDCFSHFSFSTTKRKCNQLILSCGNAHAQPSAVHFPQPIVRRPRPGRYRPLVLARHFSFWPQRCLGSPQHVMAAPSSTETFCSTNGTCAPLRMRSGNSYETAQYEVVGALGGTDPGPVPM